MFRTGWKHPNKIDNPTSPRLRGTGKKENKRWHV